MGLVSWQRSGSLNGWQDFGHEDSCHNAQRPDARAPTGEPAATRRPAATVSPGLHSPGDIGPTPQATADSRDRGNVRMWQILLQKSAAVD